ncbi:MAG: SGNH/GDSL hydrolase family protein [Acidimicrobiales bacterium]
MADGGLRRWLGGQLPGAKVRRAQSEMFAAEWTRENGVAAAAAGPLWVALGDSTAQGIGASERSHGYVLRVLDRLRAQRHPGWQVVNLSRTGARVADVLGDQLAAMAEIRPADLVTCAVGANDLLPTRGRNLVSSMVQLAESLPAGALLATLPQGVSRARAEEANAVIRATASSRGLVVVDLWARTGPPWKDKYAGDMFHPNDRGYDDWVSAFCDALGLAR